VIFVNIDDNEQGYLKVLMDGIFGRDEFVCNMIWEKKYRPQNQFYFSSKVAFKGV
jgi:adenine-specific DNA-methyltransferase